MIAALCWFDEPIPFLRRLVRSLDGVCDELVALDGRWQLFPGNEINSPRAQEEAIWEEAHLIGLPARVVIPTEVFESQVAKRAELFRLVLEHAGADDWVIVTDGDDSIASCSTALLRLELQRTDLDVAMIRATNTAAKLPSEQPIRRIFRCLPGLTVETAHNGVKVDDRWLLGDSAYCRLEPALQTTVALLHLHHEDASRGDHRNARALAYRQARRRQKVEAWA